MNQKKDPTRKLVAIMFTDLVGFSALMGKDEKRAMEVVRKNRELHQSSIRNQGGQLLKEMGDGIKEHIRAKELDPLTPLHTAWLGELYINVGEYNKAINEARASVEGGRKFLGLAILGNAYLGKGMMEEAVKMHEELVEIAGPPGYFWLGPPTWWPEGLNNGKRYWKN